MIKHIIKEIQKANEVNDYQKCIELCRKAIPLTDLSEFEEWFRIRFNLVKFLREESNNKSDNIEESVEILHELLTNTSQKEKPGDWAKVNMALGSVYDDRVNGEEQANLEKVIEYYKQALYIFTKNKYPEHWAAVTSRIGYAYAVREAGETEENIINGIRYIRDSLTFYTKHNRPYDYWDVLKELSRLQKMLKDNKVWDELWTEFKERDEIDQDIKKAWNELQKEL